MNEQAEEPLGAESGSSGGIQSVATALDLLDCLATEPELGVAELGRRLGVAKSTRPRHRLLALFPTASTHAPS